MSELKLRPPKNRSQRLLRAGQMPNAFRYRAPQISRHPPAGSSAPMPAPISANPGVNNHLFSAFCQKPPLDNKNDLSKIGTR